ncbi:hypothetical protein LTR84_004268 [Exophiala bonariae]|uniref:Uncharacterized protein n=1 Tax=Exophiala bonariae TaxID=1690606 RepID=A0AAV9N8D8_9EURO|nr:hypothetical protein LTR84_004268 [Exophiala bonariae]
MAGTTSQSETTPVPEGENHGRTRNASLANGEATADQAEPSDLSQGPSALDEENGIHEHEGTRKASNDVGATGIVEDNGTHQQEGPHDASNNAGATSMVEDNENQQHGRPHNASNNAGATQRQAEPGLVEDELARTR